MNRRGFLQGIIATSVAPAIVVRSGILMRIRAIAPIRQISVPITATAIMMRQHQVETVFDGIRREILTNLADRMRLTQELLLYKTLLGDHHPGYYEGGQENQQSWLCHAARQQDPYK